MSFSGLKTAVINIRKKLIENDSICGADIAASFQKSVADILCRKISLAIDVSLKKYDYFENVVVSGGVAANNYLRTKLKKTVELKNKTIFFPPPKLCTDNGAMIAWAGFELYKKGVTTNLNIQAKPRWPLEKIGDRI